MSVTYPELQEFMRNAAEADRGRKHINVTADTLDEALSEASVELGVPLRRIDYEVLQNGSRGFLGMGKKSVIIIAYPGERSGDGEELSEDDFEFPDAEETRNRDGEAFVRLSPEGVLLKVTEPAGNGIRVTDRQALHAIRERGEFAVDSRMVSRIVRNADDEWVAVARYDYNPARDASLGVEIVELEMKAFLMASPPGPGGTDPSAENIVTFLQTNGVVEGINDDAVRRFENKPVYRERYLIAEGSKPQNGDDARIMYNFPTGEEQIKLKEKNGRVDFREMNLVHNVVEGQVLARKVPAGTGIAGRTVTGKLLPARDGRDVDLLVGKNVVLNDDGSVATAAINGQVVMISGKVTVEPVYLVNGDVNLRNGGNVLFLGNVVVKGNVDDGFEVKAAGNIEVHGSVGKCVLDAEGDIIVHQGVNGKGAGTVRAGRHIYSKFIENSTAEASGLIVVSDGIINATVFSNSKIICRGRRAAIVGGVVRASQAIDAKTLGSVAGMETQLEVGYDPRTRERLIEVENERNQLSPELDEVNLNLGQIEKQMQSGRKVTDERKEQAKQLAERRRAIKDRLAELDAEVREMQSYLDQIEAVGRVSASGTVFAGVKVWIKDASLEVRQEFKAVSFLNEGGTVQVTKYAGEEDDISIKESREASQ